MIGDDTCVIDTNGRYIAPGLIDGHNHVDSISRCSEFVRWVLPRGTTTVITPRCLMPTHEILCCRTATRSSLSRV
jgi:adenine deaminase